MRGMLHVVLCNLAISMDSRLQSDDNLRQGPVMPQNAARSQNAMSATTHSFHGMSSLTRRMSLMLTNVLDDRTLVVVGSLSGS